MKNLQKFNSVLLPIYIYLIFLLSFYLTSGYLQAKVLILYNFFLSLNLFIFPIAQVIWLVLLIKKHFPKKQFLFSVLLCAVPGVLLGIQLTYGFLGAELDVYTFSAVLAYFAMALFFGVLFASLGLLVALGLNLNKKIKL